MDARFHELIRILDCEHAIYRQYLELLSEHQRYLANSDTGGIGRIIEKTNTLAEQAINLENSRVELIDDISSKMVSNLDNIALSRLLESFRCQKFAELELLKEKILEMHYQLTTQNVKNDKMIEQSFKVINHTMTIIDGNERQAVELVLKGN